MPTATPTPFRWAAALVFLTTLAGLAPGVPGAEATPPNPYRLPATSLTERVIWGASCDGPAGTGLSFGGQDQAGDEGRAPTRVLENGKWTEIRGELREKNKL